MGIVLFDWETTSTTKKAVKSLLSMDSLFDGYLTELTSYQQLPQKILFDWKTASTTKKVVEHLFSRASLFDAYLTEH
jgi:hypothetical protein